MSTSQLTLLKMVKKISIWDPLRVLVMDIAGYVENYSKTVDIVSKNPAVISLVVMFNTDLDTNTSWRDTMWPNYRQIRSDKTRWRR